MNAHDLEKRMDNLERIVEPLRELPDRVAKVELQIVQLRAEMRDEFSAIRRDMVTKHDLDGFAAKEDLVGFATKEDLVGLATKEDLVGFATKEDLVGFATKEDLVGLATKEDLVGFATKEELAQAVAPLATKDEMRMLHEDLVQRLKVIGEGQARRRPRR